MKLTEAKAILNKIMPDLKRLANQDEFELERYTSEERTEMTFMNDVANRAREIDRRFTYMNRPILAEGFLVKNSQGRYYIESDSPDNYFTSGASIEIWDERDERFYLTRIEHDGEDYYAVSFKGLKLEDAIARTRY